MSVHFHSLFIKEIIKETNDCVSILFSVPENKQPLFQYKPGQSLTVKTTINKEEVRRTYSICSSPLDNELRIAVKKVPGGLFSTFANQELKVNDMLEVMEPVGKFNTPLEPANQHQYLAFAAGSGITPILSLIKTTLAIEPQSQFTLVYGNKSRSSIIFFEALEALKNKYLNRFRVFHILSREKTEAAINFGRITQEKLTDLSKAIRYSETSQFFICGPEEMIFTVKDFLIAQGVDKKKIHFELFTTSGSKQAITTAPIAVSDSPKSSITIKLDGRTFDFEQTNASQIAILDAALQQGADLPYACKGGMCCTCKARLLEGKVHMNVHWGLEDDEIQQGYILTCQAHPITDKLVIDFDVK